MDNANPSPPKRPRNLDILTAQLEKPTRFFPFNRKTPSNSLQGKSSRTERVSTVKSERMVSSSLQNSPFPSSMKFVPNKEANISNKLQKLKLKSPDGRDLGEINVQLLPQKGDSLGGKTIMLQKHSLFGKLDNPSTVSILKPLEKSKQVAIHGSFPIQTPISQSNFVTNNKSAGESLGSIPAIMRREGIQLKTSFSPKYKLEPRHSPLILRHSEISKYPTTALGSKVFYINVDKQTGLNTVKTINNIKPISKAQIPSNQKIIMVQAENYPDSTEGKRNNSFGTTVESRSVVLSRNEASTDSTSSTPNAKNLTNIFWNPSKYAELMSKTSNQQSKGIENEIVKSVGNTVTQKSITIVTHALEPEHIKISSKSSSASVTTGVSGRKQKPKLNNWTIMKTSGKKLEKSRKSSSEFEIVKNGLEIKRVSQTKKIIVHNLNSENAQNVTSTTNNILHIGHGKQGDESTRENAHPSIVDDKSNGDLNLRENIMVVVHGDMNTIKESEKKGSKKMATNKEMSMEVDDDLTLAGNATKSNGATLSKDSSPDKTSKLNSSPPQQHDLDIIEKALSSCMDQTLREKALKALADCGIGVKRDVPLPPTVSVCDSETQTTVFSLLKPDVLVECNENSPSLKRLQIVNDKPCDLPPVSPEPLHPTSEGYFDPSGDTILQTDIQAILDDLVSDTSKKGVDQIKDIFSKPDPLVSKAFKQIQEDFEAATNIDADGLLGIHRAVLSGDVKEVQRQLVVLKAVKKSIEVPNADGKTSLELAVLNEADRCIINTLLTAGAQPSIPMKLHESAIIIASKISSKALPDLIQYVQPASLLDYLDSEGAAPLHYCSQLGNIEGVKLLVSAGANIDLRDAKSGRTPLFHALETKNFEIAWFLIDNGASPNITNFAGQLPAALVDEYRQNTLAEKLNQAVR